MENIAVARISALRPSRLDAIADRALGASGLFWLLVAIAGHAIFAFYIIAFYGGAVLAGEPQRWNSLLDDHGLRAGDIAGNIFLGIHLALAAIVTLGGPLQLIPQLRRRAIGFHRWNGRIYLATACATSLAAFYLIASRGGTIAGPYVTAGILLDGALILIFSGLALKHALARDIAAHRRWAMRTFIVVSGVWFFRIGLMLWFLVNRGPVGHTDGFDGPFDIFWAFGNYLVPLFVLELYMRVQAWGSAAARLGMATLLVVLSVTMGGGIAGATMMMWLPRI